MKISIIKDERITSNKAGYLSHVDGEIEFDTLKEFGEISLNYHLSPGIFKDQIKKQDHLESIQFLSYDFDKGDISSQDIYFTLISEEVNGIIIGSKSYTDENEKFHVFIPIDKPMTSPDLYKYVVKKYASLHKWGADGACMECSRYFYKHSKLLYTVDNYSNLEIDRFIKLKEIEDKIEGRKKEYYLSKPILGEPMDKFKKTKYYKWLEEGKLKVDGERYNLCCRIIGAMKCCGLSQVDAQSLIDQHSIYGKSHNRDSVTRRLKDFLL